MKIDLKGKTALVTGSTAGIGLAIAKGLAAAGARIIVNGRKQGTVDKAVIAVHDSVNAAAVSGIAANVSTPDGCEAIVNAIPSVDILINNAGIFEPKPFFDILDADWTRFFQTNVMSGVRLSRAYLPGMLKQNWGRIVFISSESALNIPAEMIHYGFTKTAQLAVSRGLAELTAGTNVTVNSVLPGPTRSDGVEDFLKAMASAAGTTPDEMAAGFVKAHRPSSLIQRFASVEEVANMVVYVASKEASATNGAALRVEGGIIRTIARPQKRPTALDARHSRRSVKQPISSHLVEAASCRLSWLDRNVSAGS
jgi:NAD(P)-dependent dehydrogenase (short-subunit alcohol dehydrogenase family)